MEDEGQAELNFVWCAAEVLGLASNMETSKHGHGGDEAGDGAGDTDVEKSGAGVDARLDADERAESADQRWARE